MYKKIALIGTAVAVSVISTFAATNASDNAANAAYAGGWATGSNGGTGFQAWQITLGNADGNTNGTFIGDSATNGSGDGADAFVGDINTAGKAWGMYANASNGAGSVQARRPFFGALNTGQTFSISMDNGFVDTGGTVGFALENSSNQVVWELFFNGGATNYTINAGSVSGTPPAFTDTGMNISFTLTSTTQYSVTLQKLDGTAPVTITGSLLAPSGGQGITQARLYNFTAGPGGDHNLFFNSMAIVPEPSTLSLLAGPTILGALFFARRRRS